jgi:hypothetical protein
MHRNRGINEGRCGFLQLLAADPAITQVFSRTYDNTTQPIYVDRGAFRDAHVASVQATISSPTVKHSSGT